MEKLRLRLCYTPRSGERIFLHGDMTDAELWGFLSKVAGGRRNTSNDPGKIVDFILGRKRRVLDGGIVATKGGFELVPGTMCEIRSWADWKALKEGRGAQSPDMGYQPDPFVDTSGPQARLVAHYYAQDQNELLVDYGELRLAIEELESDLIAFCDRLDEWLTSFNLPNKTRLIRKLGQWFHFPV